MSPKQETFLFNTFLGVALITLGILVSWLIFISFQGTTEDDPGWNCATMGNQVCGATLVEDEIGTALTCWNRRGDIFCQEVVTP